MLNPSTSNLGRRAFLERMGLASAGLIVGVGRLQGAGAPVVVQRLSAGVAAVDRLPAPRRYLEFGEPDGDLTAVAAGRDTRSWRIRVDGLVERAREFDLDRLAGEMPMEERRVGLHAQAEAPLPWTGFALAALVRWARPLPSARFLRVVSFVRPDLAANQRRVTRYPWPYREGLGLEDAMDERAFVAMGLHGRELPLLRGAPLRLVLPWQRGHKCAKGIVRFEFTERQPATFWGELAPRTHPFDGDRDSQGARS